MSRYIDADELIFIGFDNPDDDHLFEFVPKEFIDNAPTADVVEVVHGKWKVSELGYLYCSKCGTALTKSAPRTNYCSCCGSKMDERRTE